MATKTKKTVKEPTTKDLTKALAKIGRLAAEITEIIDRTTPPTTHIRT